MCDMKTFDTEPLMQELNSVLNSGLSKMLSKYIDRYNLLENTHTQIMNLPSVRFEMNNRENESKSDKQHFPCFIDVKSRIIQSQDDTIRKLLNEITELKESLIKCNCNTRDNVCEKINIKLEIVDIPVDEVNPVSDKVVIDDTEDDTDEEEDEEDDEDEEEDEEEEEDEDEDEEEEEDEDEEEDDKIIADADKIIADADKIIADADKIVAAKDDDDVETENEKEEEEDDFFEIEIDDITYCTNNEETGIIYEVDKDGDIGKRIGYLKDGEPIFDNE